MPITSKTVTATVENSSVSIYYYTESDWITITINGTACQFTINRAGKGSNRKNIETTLMALQEAADAL